MDSKRDIPLLLFAVFILAIGAFRLFNLLITVGETNIGASFILRVSIVILSFFAFYGVIMHRTYGYISAILLIAPLNLIQVEQGTFLQEGILDVIIWLIYLLIALYLWATRVKDLSIGPEPKNNTEININSLHRSPSGAFILSLFTLGLYAIYWFYTNNRYLGLDKKDHSHPILAATLGLLAPFGEVLSFRKQLEVICESEGYEYEFSEISPFFFVFPPYAIYKSQQILNNLITPKDKKQSSLSFWKNLLIINTLIMGLFYIHLFTEFLLNLPEIIFMSYVHLVAYSMFLLPFLAYQYSLVTGRSKKRSAVFAVLTFVPGLSNPILPLYLIIKEEIV